jgi:hypothetical protein
MVRTNLRRGVKRCGVLRFTLSPFCLFFLFTLSRFHPLSYVTVNVFKNAALLTMHSQPFCGCSCSMK